MESNLVLNNLFSVIPMAKRKPITNRFKLPTITFDELIDEPIEQPQTEVVATSYPEVVNPFEHPYEETLAFDDIDYEEPKEKKETEEQTQQVADKVDNSLLRLDIEDLLKQEGITSINGKKIKFGRKTRRDPNASYGSKNSHHKRIDPNTGYAAARDISIIGGTNKDYNDFKNILLNNKRVRTWMATHNWGIINEIIPQVMGRTKATGPHFHFGPDRWAKRIWNQWKSNPKTYVTTYIS